MSLNRFGTKSQPQNRHIETSKRSILTQDTLITAFDRIYSSKSLVSSTLPSFLLTNKPKLGITQLDLLRFNLTSKPKLEKVVPIIDLSDSTLLIKEPEKSHDRLKISAGKLSDIKNAEKIIYDIFNPTLPSTETILTFSKRKLTRGDLVCFKEGDLPENVVDCYMSMLKVCNKLAVKHKPMQRVIIVNSSHSKMLFQVRREIPKPKTDIFQYDIMMFPIFDGYWTLMTVSLRTGMVRFFDGLVPNRDINSMLVVLRRFLIQANVGNDPNINEGFLKYEANNVVPGSIGLKDSGIYICKIAESIANNRPINNFDFRTMRKDMLTELVKISLKLV